MRTLRQLNDRVLRVEARNHRTIQALPHTAPLLGACLCNVLMLLPVEDPHEPSPFFRWSVVLTMLAAAGWLAVELGNDYAHFRYGLLEPQRRRTVCLMVGFGTLMASARLVHLTTAIPGLDLSLEWLHRLFVGAPYFVFRFFGLDMWGWCGPRPNALA